MSAKRKRTPEDFEARYFDLLQDSFDSLGKKMDDNTRATETGFRDLKKRVHRLEAHVFKTALPPWYTDRKLLYLALASILVFLLITAAIFKVKVPAL